MIRLRLEAGDVDELHAAAAALAEAFTITRTSRPYRRRSGDGVSLYLDAELPAAASGVDRGHGPGLTNGYRCRCPSWLSSPP
ncbi:hypothetical protein EV385_6634 [Krasilnikovia cinnamomea]|uniref:Uncharacterized protein n=1 Tax=Krasilnikovia cinnamomea TaxID=349313 RepID=A0A4Q7Z7W7_9ACTN|nr:hypothetical protein EV385_6634 [Krasilnikovia cinnamomea]